MRVGDIVINESWGHCHQSRGHSCVIDFILLVGDGTLRFRRIGTILIILENFGTLEDSCGCELGQCH